MKCIKLVDYCMFLVKFCVSGNFPETAWRAAHSRPAAHTFIRVLAAQSRPPGDAWLPTPLWGWWMKRLAVLVEPPGGTSKNNQFLVFFGFL